MEKLVENLEIAGREQIDTAISGASFFTGQTERILRCCQQEGQIVMPQIVVETELRREIEQPVDFTVDGRSQNFGLILTFIEATADVSEMKQDAVLVNVTVDNQIRNFPMRSEERRVGEECR